MTGLKRPRVDDLLLRDRCLSTIHPAKKLFTGDGNVRKGQTLSKSVFASTSNATILKEELVKLKTRTQPLSDLTNTTKENSATALEETLRRDKLTGFRSDGLLSLCGASNAVAKKLVENETSDQKVKGEDACTSDLETVRDEVISTLRKVSYLTKEQKVGLIALVKKQIQKDSYGVELNRYETICKYLNQEQERYLLRMRQAQMV